MITQHKHSEYVLKYNEVMNIINICDLFRDRIIIKCLYFGGMRVGEVERLEIQHIDFGRALIHIKNSKYNKTRTIPILDSTFLSDLRIYCGANDKGNVFGIKKRWIQDIVKRMGEKAGVQHPNPSIKRINPHLFRHSIARHLKNKNYPIEFIQKFLGHSSYKTTADEYGTLSLHDMQEIITRKTGDRSLLGEIKHIPEVLE